MVQSVIATVTRAERELTIFLAIKALVNLGTSSYAEIAEKLGLRLSAGKKVGELAIVYVAIRVRVAQMPRFVFDEYCKMIGDRKASSVRWSDATCLYAIYNREYDEYPDGDGPEFQKAWKRTMER